MSGEKVVLVFENDFFEKLKKHAKKKGYENVSSFIREVLRRQIYWHKKSGMKDAESVYLDKFSASTNDTRKIMRSIKAK